MAASAPPIELPTAEPLPESSPAPAAPAIREDQVKNAVAFLSHPKVKSSTVEAKRSFLERKGLTAEEIDAAFQQVPQDVPESKPVSSAPAASVAQRTTANQAPLKPWQQTQPQQQQSYMGQQMVPYQPVPIARPPLRWSQIVLRLGFVGVSAYTLHRFLYPHVMKLVSSYRAAQLKKKEDEAKLLTELIAAVRSLKECQAELLSTGQALSSAASDLNERRKEDEDRRMLESISALPPSRPGAPNAYANGNYQMSYTVKDAYGNPINALRNPAEMYGSPSYGASSSSTTTTTTTTNGSSTATPQGYSSSYMEIMEMVKKNITPPNVRTDIQDTPPNPNQPISESKLAPQPKPWETLAATRASLGSTTGFPPASSSADATPSFLSSPITEDQLPSPPPPPPPVSILSSYGSAAGGWKPPVPPQRSVRVTAVSTATAAASTTPSADSAVVAVPTAVEETVAAVATTISAPVEVAEVVEEEVVSKPSETVISSYASGVATVEAMPALATVASLEEEAEVEGQVTTQLLDD